jgi:hypothetical protein
MLKEPVWSFREILGGYSTFQEVAISKGYIVNGEEVKNIFTEANDYNSPEQQRSLFVMLTLEGYPTLQLLNENPYVGYMTADYNNQIHDRKEIRQMLLAYFYRYFRSLGKIKIYILYLLLFINFYFINYIYIYLFM